MDAMSPWEPNPEYLSPKAGEPPLHRAARLGDDAAIRALAEAGADLNEAFDIALDPSGRPMPATPLMVAAGSGEGATVKTVELLLELGADPQLRQDGRSAVDFACHGLGWNYPPGGDPDRLRWLLEKGSPLPEDPEATQRLLADTAGEGDAKRLKVLLDRGLSPDAFWDPVAARQDAAHFSNFLEDNRTPDFFADLPEETRAEVEANLRAMDREMEERNASAPYSFQIPLFQAAESGSETCVRLLLAAGADISVRDNSGRTALYHAGSEAVVHALLEAGIPREDADQFGWSPLVSALSDGEEGLPRVRALVAAGADVNGTHDRGYTVFMSAVGSNRSPEMLRLLIASGADPHAVTELGYNAFHAAIDVNFDANAEESVRDTLGYLKELGVDLEHRNGAGQTPLVRAIVHGTSLEVQVLCELGADVEALCPLYECGSDACAEEDLPPLFHAILGPGVSGDEKVEWLLKAGANPLVTDSEGYTPLAHYVGELCENARDPQAAYDAFYTGFPELTSPKKEREAFLADVRPEIRSYVEAFAREIPLGNASACAEEWRAETIAGITALAAYETWLEASEDA